MKQYLNSVKQAQEEEETLVDEEELARIHALEEKKKSLVYRITRMCKR